MSTTTYLGGPLDGAVSPEPARTIYRDRRGNPMRADVVRNSAVAYGLPFYVRALPPLEGGPRVYRWTLDASRPFKPWSWLMAPTAPRTTREDPS